MWIGTIESSVVIIYREGIVIAPKIKSTRDLFIFKVILLIYDHRSTHRAETFEKSKIFWKFDLFGGILDLKITILLTRVINYANRPYFILTKDNLTSNNEIVGYIYIKFDSEKKFWLILGQEYLQKRSNFQKSLLFSENYALCFDVWW